jgi:hypothetical protein
LCGGGLVLVLGEGLGEVLGLLLLLLGEGVGVLVSLGLLDGLAEVLTDFDGEGLLVGVADVLGDVVPLLGVGVAVLDLVLLLDGLGLLVLEALRDGLAEFVLVRLDGFNVVVLVVLGVTPRLARWWRRCRRCAAVWASARRAGRWATVAVNAAAFGRTEHATFTIGGLLPVSWFCATELANAAASPTRPRFSSAMPPTSAPSASDLRTCILTWPASRSKFPPRVRIHAP